MFNETFIRYRSQDWNTWNIKHEFLSKFILGANLPVTVGKYSIKIIFDIKIEIDIFKTSNVPNLNKVWALLILGLIWD